MGLRESVHQGIREARRRRLLASRQPRNGIDVVATALGAPALPLAFVAFFFVTFVCEGHRWFVCGNLLVFGIGALLVEARVGGRSGRRVGVVMMALPCLVVGFGAVWPAAQ